MLNTEGVKHQLNIFKRTKIYAFIISMYYSEIGNFIIGIVTLCMLAFLALFITYINQIMLNIGILPKLGTHAFDSYEMGDAGMWCLIEIIVSIFLFILISAVFYIIDDTIKKVRIDLLKFDLESGSVKHKRTF